MLDGNQADDKIIAVLYGDATYGAWQDVSDVPTPLLDRLRHYFLTYKQLPDATQHSVEIAEIYPRDEALEVIRSSVDDYQALYGDPDKSLRDFLHYLTQSLEEEVAGKVGQRAVGR